MSDVESTEGPGLCFSGCLCTIIRGRELGNYLQLSSHSQVSFQTQSSPKHSENAFEGLVWVPLVCCGMAEGRSRRDGLCFHSCSKISAAFGLPIPVVLAAFTQY